MANQEVKIFFKVEGIDGYITDLNDLQQALSKADTETKDLSNSQKEANTELQKGKVTLKSLNEELNTLQKELQDTEVGSEAFVELQGKIKDTEKALNDAKNGQQSFTDTLSNAPGAVGAVTRSVQGLSTAFKALLANPVILVVTGIVAAVTALFKAFTSTKEGGEALDRVLAGLSAVFDVLRDAVVKLGEPILKLFKDPKQAIIDFGDAIKENITNRFEGILEFIPSIGTAVKLLFERRFSEAAEVAGNAFLKVTTGVEGAVGKIGDAFDGVKETINEAVNEANEAARLTGVLQKIADRERELNVLRAEQNALIAQTKLRVDDTTLSIEERRAALESAASSEQNILNQQLNLERERLNALVALANQSDSDSETLDQLAAQRIKLAQLEEQSLNKQTELQGKRKALNAEEKTAADERKRLTEEQLAREFAVAEEIRRKRLDERALELDDLRLKYEEDVKAAGKNKELLLQIEEQYRIDGEVINKKYDDNEKLRIAEQQQTIQDILARYAVIQYENEEQRILAELELQFLADLERLRQAGATAEQLEALEVGYQKKVTEVTKKGEKDREKLRKDTAVQGIKLFGDVLGAFQELNNARTEEDEREARKQFERNKKFSIAQALISTGLAVNAALTAGGNPAKLATGAQFVEAGIALVTGLAQVAKIRATQFDGGNTGGNDNIQPPTFNPQTAIDTRNQQLGGLQNAGGEINLGNPQQQTIRAYVVSTDVESSLAANQQIENLSRL
jgi:hypothetical protein